PHRELLDQRFELPAVLHELDGPGSPNLLVDLGPRLHAVRPWQSRMEGDPAHERPRERCRDGTDRGRAHHVAERIAQMTDRLVRRHPAPLPWAVGRQALYARDEAGAQRGISERLLHERPPGPRRTGFRCVAGPTNHHPPTPNHPPPPTS